MNQNRGKKFVTDNQPKQWTAHLYSKGKLLLSEIKSENPPIKDHALELASCALGIIAFESFLNDCLKACDYYLNQVGLSFDPDPFLISSLGKKLEKVCYIISLPEKTEDSKTFNKNLVQTVLGDELNKKAKTLIDLRNKFFHADYKNKDTDGKPYTSQAYDAEEDSIEGFYASFAPIEIQENARMFVSDFYIWFSEFWSKIYNGLEKSLRANKDILCNDLAVNDAMNNIGLLGLTSGMGSEIDVDGKT